MTDTVDDDDGDKVVSKFKVDGINSQKKLLPMNLPLNPLWHYYDVQ